MADFPGTIYAPPGVYTRTRFESPLSGVLAGVRIPVYIGTGNELLQQQDLEVIRGSSSSVDQQVPQEDETGRAVVSISETGVVTLGAFNGERRRIQVRQFPITNGDGTGTIATDPSSIFVTINGQPDVVLSVARADIGVIEISTAPDLGDDVRITYFFKRTDTQITDTVSDQITPQSAILDGAIGNQYEFTSETNQFQVTVDLDVTQATQQVVDVTFPTGAVTAATVVSLINGAAAGTSLLASEFTNNFGLTAVRLVADRDLLIGDGTANVVLGFTQNQNTNRNKTFFVFNGPVVDGSNGGITTTDTSKVTVRVDGVQVIPTEVDGRNRAIELPFAPEVGASLTIQYFFNTWQDTFDYLANINVTEVLRCGIVPGNSDFIEGADFILKDDLIVWGTAFLINPGVTTPGAPPFGSTQISGLLIDNRWFLADTTVVIDDSVNPPVEDRTKFQLPAQPTTGNGRDTPLGIDVWKTISNNRLDLPTNNPNLVKMYWGFGLQDALQRGQVNVTEVEGTIVTLEDPVPVGAGVWATFWYNILVDEEYTVTVETSGPSSIGTYFLFDSNGDPIFTPTFGVKGPALTGVTIQFPSGSEITPDVHFEGGTAGPVEETVTVQFANEDSTIAKFTVGGSGPYNFVTSESDRARFTIDSSALAGGAAGIDLSAPHGIQGLGFNASLLGEEIQYTDDSGKTTYDILAGINDNVSFSVDSVVVTVDVPAQTAVDADAYVEAINAEVKLSDNAPFYDGQTRFLGALVVTAGEYDKLVFNYTGVTNGATGPVTATVAPGTFISPTTVAAAVNSALDTAIAALPAIFDGLDVTCTANADGQMRFTFEGADTDLGTFATGTVTSALAVLGETVTIDGVTLTGDLSQDVGGLNFDTGQARATLIPTGVEPGDDFTIDAGGGPITITAAGAQTPGGLNFNEGVQATGTLTVSGPIPGDTVTIDGITLTALGAQTPGGLDFDEGTRASGTATLAAVEFGDTITIDTSVLGGGPVVLTADNTITPGGLNFNVGTAATGTVQTIGVRPASAGPYPVFPADTVTIGGSPLTPVEGARTPGADDFDAGTRALGTLTVVADALPSTGVLFGDQIVIAGIALTADDVTTPGGLNFDAGTQATSVITAALAPGVPNAAATVTIDSGAGAGGPYVLTAAGGPRVSGASNYDETLATTAAIAADIAAAINDPANIFAVNMSAAVGPGPSDVTLTWTVPGTLANGLTNAAGAAQTTVTSPWGGGVGTEITTATAIVAAILDPLNGISGSVQAHNTGGGSAVVDLRALTPGLAGNSISTVSTAPARLTFGAATLAGGAGDDDTAATDAAAAVNDAANSFDTVVTAVTVGNIMTLTAVTPGAVGNTITLSTTAAGRFVLSGVSLGGGVGDDISAATSLVAAIGDAANGLVGGVVSDNTGGTSAVVDILSFTPGLVGNGVLMAESTGGARITLSAATLLGGAGDDTTVAASIAAAINDGGGNGIVDTVTATSAVGVVTMTAVTPGNNGNIIDTTSSSAIRLLMSGLTLAGGSGTDFTVASSIAAAINDAGNGLAVAVAADNAGGTSTTVTVWALVPGVLGNTFTIASSDGTRLPVSGAAFAGGATVVQVASSIVAAISDAGNGLNGIVTADNSTGTSAVVDITAADPGPQGNFITLASSNGVTLPVSAATLTGGSGLGGGVFEFLDAASVGEDFAVLAGMSTDALPGFEQTKIIDGDVARRFTVAGTSGRLIYDRIIVRNRITPGSGSLSPQSQVAQTQLVVEGTNAQTETGLAAKAFGQSEIEATIRSASLFGEVGFKDGQVPSGTFADSRDGQPQVQFFADGGINPQNNVFKYNIDGTPVTVVFTDAAGGAIPVAGQADVPLGPRTTPNTVLWQIMTSATGAGLAVTVVAQEGAGTRLISDLFDTNSAVTIDNGNANDVLGFSEGATATRTLVEPEVTASALMMHHSSSINGVLLDYQSPDATWFADQALAGTELDSSNAQFLFIESQANNVVGLGASSNIAFLEPSTDSWLRTGTGIGVAAGEGASGETGFQGFFVTSSDPIDGSGTANTSCLNNGAGQDGILGQSYRDVVTGLVFTILEREGGAAYPTGAGAFFTFEVRKLVTTDANVPVNSLPGLELTVANTEGSTIPTGDTAIVETFDRGGTEPMVGDSYFVTYNFSKTAADFETQLFTNQRAVERNYGSITPDNPVSLAAFLAFLNGAIVLGIKQVPKVPGSNQASTPSYLDALNDLTGALPGGAILDTITPLKGDDVDLFLALSNHCDIQSSIRFRAERTGLIGVASGTQPTDVGGIAQQIQNTRIRLVYPDIVTVTIQDALGNDKQFLIDGTFLAAAVAGNRASTNIDVATPWTRARIVGFDQLARNLDAVEENQVAVQGVTVLSQRGTVIRIRQGLTTDPSNVLTKLPTVITIADEVQRSSRRDLDRFIGIKFLPGVLSQIEGQLSTTMKALKNAEIITAFTGIQARTTNDPTVVEVEAFYQPVFPLLYIVITFNLRSNLGG
jgi:hypothetical protein